MGLTLAPYLQVGVFPAATCTTQRFGVAHDTGVIACEHAVVAGGTTVAAAVPGGGWVHRDGGAQALRPGVLFLAGVFVAYALDRTKATEFLQVYEASWSRAGTRSEQVLMVLSQPASGAWTSLMDMRTM